MTINGVEIYMANLIFHVRVEFENYFIDEYIQTPHARISAVRALLVPGGGVTFPVTSVIDASFVDSPVNQSIRRQYVPSEMLSNTSSIQVVPTIFTLVNQQSPTIVLRYELRAILPNTLYQHSIITDLTQISSTYGTNTMPITLQHSDATFLLELFGLSFGSDNLYLQIVGIDSLQSMASIIQIWDASIPANTRVITPFNRAIAGGNVTAVYPAFTMNNQYRMLETDDSSFISFNTTPFP
jgi:hypothetical protein